MKPLSLTIAALVSVGVASLSGRAQTGPAPAAPSVPGFIFSGLVAGANPAPQTIAVPNAAGAPVQATSSRPSVVTVTVKTQAGTTSVTATVNAAGLPPGVTVVDIDLTSGSKLIQKLKAWLALVKPLPNDSAYQVELRYTGYTGLADAYPDCKVNPQGFDFMTGIVVGRETLSAREVAMAEDVLYRGTLGRGTVIDYCESRGRRGPQDDERVWCAATLTGIASMDVELTVYGESDRGAFVKAEPVKTGPAAWFSGSVSGTCDTADMNQWQREYPAGDSGGGPSGQAIDESVASGAPRLFASGRPRLVVGTFAPQRPSGRSGRPDGWTLKVISKLQ
jgi:hypothetical protein